MDASAAATADSPTMIALKLFAVFILVLLNGFFVAAEFALVKIRDSQLDALVRKGSRAARVTRKILANLDASLSACQLGITLASLALGWVGEPVFSALLTPVLNAFNIQSPELRHSLSFLVGFSALTFLHIVAGEQAPKWYAIQQPLPTSLFVAYPLKWFHKASYPFIWLLNHASLWLLRRFGIEATGEGEGVHSHDELRVMVATSQRHAGGTDLGRSIVINAMDLHRRRARDVMRPRHEIVVLNTESSMTEALDLAEKSRYSRFPISEGGDLDKIRGVIHYKDMFGWRLRAKTAEDLIPAARKLVYVPPTARLETLLKILLERKLHMAFVVDEYGGTVGMVTLENILEELVGQIQDEFDQEKPLAEPIADNTWSIQGAFPLHDLAELAGEPLDEGQDVVTASGFVTQRLGGFPKVGDVVQLTRATITVADTDGRTISKLTLTKVPEPPPEEEEQETSAEGAD
ncbi:MAG TPA: hemolysin family protein [Verrucomicrobiae bacterium]|nr:hemolysin family protein [Verrucomicrobiae bacterium]